MAEKNAFYDYTLMIRRGGGGTYHRHFATIEGLREAVRENLTVREISSGVLTRLTTFPLEEATDGYVEVKWQNMVACAYLDDFLDE